MGVGRGKGQKMRRWVWKWEVGMRKVGRKEDKKIRR